MSQIGSFGAIPFVVTPELIRTFEEFTRTTAGRWADFDIQGKKPKSQYIGPGLDTVSFSMFFSAQLGVNPRKELDKLVNIDREGKAGALTIGGKKLGVGLWVITGLTQPFLTFDRKGNVLTARTEVTLKEYVK